MKVKNNYLTNEELFQEWLKWRDSSNAVADRMIGEKLAQMILQIGRGVLCKASYSRYTQEDKDDMLMEIALKIIKNLKNVKPERKGSIFNFFTLAAECACKTYLAKKYRHANLMQAYRDYRMQGDVNAR